MKIGITIDKNLLERIDNYSDKNYMSRSGFISLACTQLLQQAETVNAIKQIAVYMRKISENGTLTKEQQQQLEDMERLSKIYIG